MKIGCFSMLHFFLLMNNTPLHGYRTCYLSIWISGVFFFPTFLLLSVKLLWIFVYMFLWGLCFHFFALYTQGENAGSYSNPIFNMLRNYQIVFQTGCIILHSPFTFSTTYKFQFLHIFFFFFSTS